MSENPKEEELIHYISDQDSGEDNNETMNIIKTRSKVFQNESLAIKILLSEHYRKFRFDFFHKHDIIYQEIKKQIRNMLNTYRIKLDKEKVGMLSKELKELNNLLKAYYKDSYFDNVFFVNYFKDLREMNKMKKRFISNYPKDEIETLNDIERKVKIIKAMKHYLNTRINDRLQINFESKNTFYKDPYSELKFNYLVIDEEEFSKMDENKLNENLSDEYTSNKLRRPLTNYYSYNYIPILCKGSCTKEGQLFIDYFEKWLINHINETKCEQCISMKMNLSIIKSQIKSLYTKTCIFSHNINEIMFHPLNLFTMSSFDHFYKKQLAKKPNKNIEQIVRSNIVPTAFKKLKYEIKIIYNPSEYGMKGIYNALHEYSKKTGLFIDCCYKSNIKTQICPIDFKLDSTDYFNHMKKCPFYHSGLEKRRMYKVIENEICENAIKDGGWAINNEQRIACNNGDNCNKFHTRNELFFDERFYRKLYPCTEAYYCEKDELCPKKHAVDIKVEEIFLPKKDKKELKSELDNLIEKDEKLKNNLESFNIIQCCSCLNLISGIQHKNMIFFLKCNHKVCSQCYKFFQSCPLCGFNQTYNNNYDENGKEIIEIILDYKLPKVINKKAFEVQVDNNNNLENNDIYDDDITIPKEQNNLYNNRNNYRSNRYYPNNHSFNRNYHNDNYNDYNSRGGRGRGRIRGRGWGRGRGRGGRGKYWNNNETREFEVEINSEPPHGPMYNFYKGNNSQVNNEEEKHEDSSEVRRGKGRVRASIRGRGRSSKIVNSRDYEEIQYVKNEEEEEIKESNININNFDNEEESKEVENNYEEEFSMRQEGRKGKGKVRGGKRSQYNRNRIKDDSDNEEQKEKVSSIKFSNSNADVDENSDSEK